MVSSPVSALLFLLGRFSSLKQVKIFNSSCEIVGIAVPPSTGLYSTVFCLMLEMLLPTGQRAKA